MVGENPHTPFDFEMVPATPSQMETLRCRLDIASRLGLAHRRGVDATPREIVEAALREFEAWRAEHHDR